MRRTGDGEYETNDIVISPSANNQGKISKAWQNAKQSLGEVWDGFQIIGQGWKRAFSSEGAKELKAGAEGYWKQGGEAIHTGLDVAGAIPGFGEPADGANALIYLAEGDYFNAGTSGASMVPFLGWGAVGSKYVSKLGHGIDPAISLNKASSIFSVIPPKIVNQMSKRGWTTNLIHQTVNNPFTTRTAVNKNTGNAATAYFEKSGSYVVKDNITNEIIQISNRLDSNWIPDPTIINPYIK